MMMRAGEENSSTHSKKRLGTHVGSLGNKIKTNVSDESQKLTPLLLYLNTHKQSDEIRTLYETGGKIHRKLKCDLSEMNDYLWPREMLRY